MEIVLLWLDDLDDAVFTVVLAWERLRRRCLQLGAASTAALAASAIAANEWVLPLATVAGFSVTVALLGVGLAALADTSVESRRDA